MISVVKGRCGKCGNAFVLPRADLGRHRDQEGNVMCWKCCKEVHWTSDRCQGCSELTMCKGLFLDNFKNHMKKGRIEGI